MNVYFVRHVADARSIDEDFVCLTAIDYLRIARDEFDAGVMKTESHTQADRDTWDAGEPRRCRRLLLNRIREP